MLRNIFTAHKNMFKRVVLVMLLNAMSLDSWKNASQQYIFLWAVNILNPYPYPSSTVRSVYGPISITG